MTHRIFGLLTLFALLAIPVASARQSAALVTDISGDVRVARASGGASQAATWGMQLNVGDRVTSASGARASLLYSATNSIVTVASGATHEVGSAADGAGASRPAGAPRIAAVSELTLARAGAGEVSALGGLRAGEREQAIVNLTPRQTRIRQGRPTFAWMASEEFEGYRVRLYDAAGREVWTGAATGSERVYPDDAPALVAGSQYVWNVEGETMLDAVSSQLTPFEVLSDEEETIVAEGLGGISDAMAGAADETTRDYLLGAFYVDHGLLFDAVDAFSRIARRHPDAALVHEILGNLYYDLGLKDEAVAALKRALAARN